MDRRIFISGVGHGLLSLSLVGCGFKLPGSGAAGDSPNAAPQGKNGSPSTKAGVSSQIQMNAGNNKLLIAYFSKTGNTREIANQIHANVGGDMFEIKTAAPYPADYNATVDQAKKELESNYRPTLL